MDKQIKLKIANIVEKEGEILLLKEKYQSGSAHLWNIGTGTYEEADGDVASAAKRETMEELGLEIKPKGIYKTVLTSKPDRFKVYFVVISDTLGEVRIPDAKYQSQFNESIIDAKWFAKEEALAIPDDQFVTNTIAKIIKGHIEDPKVTELDNIELFKEEISN